MSPDPEKHKVQPEQSPLQRARWTSKFTNPRTRQNILAISDQAIIGGTNFLTTIAIGRWCGREGLGIFGLGLTLIYLLVATQESLITTPYTIFLARADKKSKPTYRADTLLSYLGLSSIFAGLLIAATLVSLFAGLDRQVTYVLASLALVGPCWLLREFARRTAYAEFKLFSSLSINLIVMTVQAIGLISLAYLNRLTPATGFLVVAVANLVAGIGWLFYSLDTMKFSSGTLRLTLQKHWGLGRLMFVSQLVHALSSQALPWLIAFCLGTTATGVFIACEQIIRLANPMIVGLTNILTPRTAHVFAVEGRAGMHHIVQRAMVMLGIFMTIFSGVVILFGSQILGKLFGSEYAGYSTILFILVVAKAIEAISIGPGRGLIVLERVNDCLKADVVKCISTLSATLVLVWKWEILGAAYGALIGSILFSIVLIGLYRKAIGSSNRYPSEASTTA